MYIICKSYPNTNPAILCCANCLCRRTYENIRNETICKITKNKIYKTWLNANQNGIHFIFITIESKSARYWLQTCAQVPIGHGGGRKRDSERGEGESEATRKTVCAQRACIRRMKRARAEHNTAQQQTEGRELAIQVHVLVVVLALSVCIRAYHSACVRVPVSLYMQGEDDRERGSQVCLPTIDIDSQYFL